MNRQPKLTKAYKNLFEELANKNKYVVRTVYQHYVLNKGVPDQKLTTVVMRIDVDNGFHLSLPLANWIDHYGLTASHFFLTHPDRYYSIWESDIPRTIHELGQEVGLHTDHFYEQLAFGKDGLSNLKDDINRLGEQIGKPIKGMVHHGHPEIDALGVKNWDLTKDMESSELGLEYHEGIKSVYISPGSDSWAPKCDESISDFMTLPYSWGWNYLPWYPALILKMRACKGQVFHVVFHTMSAFEYWHDWPNDFHENPVEKETVLVFWKKRLIIFYRYFVSPIWKKPMICILKFVGIEKQVRQWLQK